MLTRHGQGLGPRVATPFPGGGGIFALGSLSADLPLIFGSLSAVPVPFTPFVTVGFVAGDFDVLALDCPKAGIIVIVIKTTRAVAGIKYRGTRGFFIDIYLLGTGR